MSEWSDPIFVAFPQEMLEDANKLAEIIDPDTGGIFTFSTDQVIRDHIYARIPLMTHFVPIVLGRDLSTWKVVIAQLAAEKELTSIPEETIEKLCNAMKLEDELFRRERN